MSADTLQKVFKTFSDPTRVRILALLEREELAVQELMDVLGMAQSRVSRHLAILRDAGLVQDRRDGTYVFYRFVAPARGRLAGGLGARLAHAARRSHQRARPRRALAGDGGARRAHAQLLRLGGARVGRAAQGLQRRRAARARDRPAGDARPARRRRRHRHRDPGRRAGAPGPARDRDRQLGAHARRGAREARGRRRARASSCAAARRARCRSPTARWTPRSRTWSCTTCPRPPRRSARWRAR